MPKCFHLLTTRLRHLAIWLVESREARIWRHHRPELVEFVHPGMLFEEGCYPVHQMLKHTKIDGMMDIGYDNSRRSDAFHIPEDAFWGSNRSIFQILSCFTSLLLGIGSSLLRDLHNGFYNSVQYITLISKWSSKLPYIMIFSGTLHTSGRLASEPHCWRIHWTFIYYGRTDLMMQ